MSKTTTKPAVGYVRMSSDQQQDSPARQRKDVEALAKRLASCAKTKTCGSHAASFAKFACKQAS